MLGGAGGGDCLDRGGGANDLGEQEIAVKIKSWKSK